MSRSFREQDIPKIQKDEATTGCKFGVVTRICPELFGGSRLKERLEFLEQVSEFVGQYHAWLIALGMVACYSNSQL